MQLKPDKQRLINNRALQKTVIDSTKCTQLTHENFRRPLPFLCANIWR